MNALVWVKGHLDIGFAGIAESVDAEAPIP
jgi:hypothetical protein